MSEYLEVKRSYKDSLFRFMFSDKESAIELYNALEGTNYGMDTEVEFTTLEDVFYRDVKNDLGFKIAGKYVVLTEHQSTVNYNMPLRHLEYITQTYKNMLENRELYSYKQIKIPTPEFYVIYTGKEKWPVKELRLSDSFMGESPENSLELVVKIIDVRYNKDKVNEVLLRSEKLRGYSLLLNYVYEYKQQGSDLKMAVDRAVNRCIEEGVLQDFLRKYAMEVKGMLFDNITNEEFTEIRAEEKWEEGRKEGRKEGLKEGQKRLSCLIQRLIAENRMDEVKLAVEDETVQNRLLDEFGL